MGDPARELSERLHLLRLAKLVLEVVDLEELLVLQRERFSLLTETAEHPQVLGGRESHSHDDGGTDADEDQGNRRDPLEVIPDQDHEGQRTEGRREEERALGSLRRGCPLRERLRGSGRDQDPCEQPAGVDPGADDVRPVRVLEEEEPVGDGEAARPIARLPHMRSSRHWPAASAATTAPRRTMSPTGYATLVRSATVVEPADAERTDGRTSAADSDANASPAMLPSSQTRAPSFLRRDRIRAMSAARNNGYIASHSPSATDGIGRGTTSMTKERVVDVRGRP